MISDKDALALAESHGATFHAEDVGGAWLWRYEGDSSDRYGVGPFDTKGDAARDLCAERYWINPITMDHGERTDHR